MSHTKWRWVGRKSLNNGHVYITQSAITRVFSPWTRQPRYNGVAVYYNMTIQLKLTKRKFKRKSQTHVSLILLVNNLLDSITLTLILESILFIPMQKQSLKYDNMLASCQLTTKLMIFTSRNYICVYFLIHVLWYQELEGITSDNHTKLYWYCFIYRHDKHYNIGHLIKHDKNWNTLHVTRVDESFAGDHVVKCRWFIWRWCGESILLSHCQNCGVKMKGF